MSRAALQSKMPPVNPNTEPSNRVLAQGTPLPIESLEVGGISILLTEAEVRSRLGEPEQVIEDKTSLIGNERYLEYSDIGIHGIQLVEEGNSSEFVVFSVQLINDKLATRNGVRVNDTRQKVVETYGVPSSIEQQGDDGEVYHYSSSTMPVSLSFTLRNNQVTEIFLSRQLQRK
ncbi:MAG: hypothetical protein ACRC8A_09335 [Microcoleaceae cyanobacterium]